ncbi:(13S,14R)-1,13-dihydroxy-N-methylcanadine 13-O-acetyltransferase AT1-like [Impatiens glandulifera]|uniref:(13S,14R)-1,13-dihydroxy-N-methylcanadine 13-O-acetyltransferase AT1-like n=1 Tax=Impatiens glandulifera TaxID=253017 RepID=UPI001FB1349C|nr:(13S,14R)-1,13-dihydroxy-N-methylcanadine 13-O-acetyltransferase AT1-like [Impatiens glandulifera]
MEVNVISQERIKPSFPTPQNLRNFNLSLLDQLIPAPFAPLTLFYSNEDLEILDRVSSLKESLSNVLTRFYPLGGKIKDELTIDCDDEGAYFAIAKTNSTLAEFLIRPKLNLMDRFLPCETSFNGSVIGARVANIQLTIFSCGGISIGFCISHKIFDGASLSTFIREWANATLGSKEPVCPSFIGSDMFPAEDLWLRDMSIKSFVPIFKMGRSATRRFLFKASEIIALKTKATLNSNPTRIEAVSAFLWKCASTASRTRKGFSSPSVQTHVVNLRRRFEPPLHEHTIGNLIWFSSVKLSSPSEMGLHELACQTRKGIREINGFTKNLVRSNERRGAIIESLTKTKDVGDGANYYGFTSWCNFGFYEADFGWGKPIWVNTVGSECPVFINLVVLMDTRDGEGIEAWVTLDEEEMALLETNDELLTFASLDPSPLQATKTKQ